MRWRAACFAILAFAGAASATAGARRLDTTALLQRYEPLLRSYSADWQPIPVETFLAAADLERPSGGRWRLVRSSPPTSALAGGSAALRLDLRACSPAVNVDACYVGRVRPVTSAAPVVYGRAWVTPTAAVSRIGTVLQYWLLYAVNDWRNSLTKPSIWQIHEGDWEFVSVALGLDGKPIAVAYSQHNLGVRRGWAQAPKSGTHPIAYVALGSHANYARAGAHVILPRFSGVPLREPDFTAAENSSGPARLAATELAVLDVSAGKEPWLSFAGAWGDGNYILLGFATRYGFRVTSRVRAGASPPGPPFQSDWRDPLAPFRDWPQDDNH